MPNPYQGRHRSAPALRYPWPSRPTRSRPSGTISRRLSFSAVTAGLTLVLVHTVTNLGDITPASAVVPAMITPSASPNAVRLPLPHATPETSPAPRAASSDSFDDRDLAAEKAERRRAKTPPPPAAPTVDPLKRWAAPAAGLKISSTYGSRWGSLHRGLDLAGPVGVPLQAMSGGVVTFAGQQGGYGNIVQIRYWDGTVSYYAHMNSVSVTAGQAVTPGQVVGQVGTTGDSTGPHLHLEIHPAGGADVDPQPWVKARGVALG